MYIHFRTLFLAVFLSGLGLLAVGLYLQHVVNLQPCPLCILQRIAFVAIFITALAGLIHNPKAVGQAVYGAMLLLFSILGGGVAAWHVRLQHLPPSQVPECGPGLEYMLDVMPLSKLLPMIFKGSGECAEVTWRFLGMSIPQWGLGWFVLFALAGALTIYRRH
jgi:protein dithiol:quinone oxidoreductase